MKEALTYILWTFSGYQVFLNQLEVMGLKWKLLYLSCLNLQFLGRPFKSDSEVIKLHFQESRNAVWILIFSK